MKQSLFIAVVIISLISLNGWADPEADLKKAISKDRNVANAKKAAEQLAQSNNEKAFQSMMSAIKGLPGEDAEYYWAVLNETAGFSNSGVIELMADFILKNKGATVSRDLLYALNGNKRRDIVPLLGQMLQKGTDEMRLMAIDHLSEVYFTDAVRVLIDFIRTLDERKDFDLVRRIAESLSSIIGKEMSPSVQTWVQWWADNKDKPESEIVKPMKGSTSDTGTAVDHMGYKRNTAFNRLKNLPKDKIIVVSALAGSCPDGKDHNFDHIENILTKFGIPHTVVPKKEFDDDKYKLEDKWFVGINCNYFVEHCTAAGHGPGEKAGGWRSKECVGPGEHKVFSPKFSDKTVKRVAEWVANGGFLFTEDGVIEELLEREFKGVVRHTEYLSKKTVKIFPAPGAATHPYLRGVFEKPEKSAEEMSPMEEKPEGPQPTESVKSETKSVKLKSNIGKAFWKIDDQSPDLKIKPDAVTVLIMTPNLKSDSKEGAPVAVTFAFTKEGGPIQVTSAAATGGSGYSGVPLALLKAGRVLHVMSHFGKQEAADDEFPLQNLIVNFLIELSERKLGQARKR